jgi:hypothetical protein
MNANLNKIAQDLYGKIQTRFPNIKLGDENAEVLSKKTDIPKARFFEFEYEDEGESLGSVAITLDEDDGIIVQISGKLADSKHYGAFKFIRSFRQFAKDRLLNFDVQNIGKDHLDKRDYNFRAKPKEETVMQPQQQPVMESKMYGTNRISYQDLGEARLVIKHSQPVNPELAAGRTMHIETIYVENAEGERFKYPFKHLNGARALAEHLKAGGNPYDGIGKHITSLSEELAQLRKFKGYVSRNDALSEAMGGITDIVFERIETIKKEVQMLQRPAFYTQFAESFESREEEMIPEEIMNDLIDRLTIRTFNEDLRTAFPYIFRLVDDSDIPVKELSPDDLLAEAETDYAPPVEPQPVNPDDYKDAFSTGKLTVRQSPSSATPTPQAQPTAGQKDLGNGFALTTIDAFGEKRSAVLDTQNNTYYVLNQTKDGYAIARTPARYLTIKDGKQGASMGGPMTNAAFEKAGLNKQAPAQVDTPTTTPAGTPTPTQAGPAPAKTPLQQHYENNPLVRGIQAKTMEDQFESFMDSIVNEDEDNQQGHNELFSRDVAKQSAALEKLKDLLSTGLNPGVDGINAALSLKGIIDSEAFTEKYLKGLSDSDDAGTAVKLYLKDVADGEIHEPLAPEAQKVAQTIIASKALDQEGGSTPPPAEPTAPDAAAMPPAEPPPAGAVEPTPAPEAGAGMDLAPAPEAGAVPAPAPEAVPAPVREGNYKLKAKLIKVLEAGATLDTELDFGYKVMTLGEAMEECGIEMGGHEEHSSSHEDPVVHSMLRSISGFWNPEEKNLTIGGTKAKIKVLKAFKDGEFEGATPEHVHAVFEIIEKLDPSTEGSQELNHIRHLSGMHPEIADEEVLAKPAPLASKAQPTKPTSDLTADEMAAILSGQKTQAQVMADRASRPPMRETIESEELTAMLKIAGLR